MKLLHLLFLYSFVGCKNIKILARDIPWCCSWWQCRWQWSCWSCSRPPCWECLSLSLSLSLVCFTVDNDSITKILYSQITRESGGSGLNFNVLFLDYYFSWFNIDKIWKSIYIWELSARIIYRMVIVEGRYIMARLSSLGANCSLVDTKV